MSEAFELDGLPLNPTTRKMWEERVDAAESAAESNHYFLALRQDDRLRQVVAALRAVLDACDDEDQRPGGRRTIPTDCIREEIAIGLGLLEREA